jgi:hypothetical protein
MKLHDYQQAAVDDALTWLATAQAENLGLPCNFFARNPITYRGIDPLSFRP